MAATIFPTSLVGSYPQPDWLIDRARLSKMVPRVRMDDLWLVDPKRLKQARRPRWRSGPEDAGLDIITDEQRRESYSNRFATALEGVDTENPGSTLNRSGKPIPVPRVTGKIRRKHPVQLRDLQFLRAHTKKTAKMTVPGPFTMSKQAQNEFYKSDEVMALDYAVAVNEEIKDEGARVRAEGARSRPRRYHRHDRCAFVLRLCGGRARQADRLFVSAGTRGLARRASVD
jgi:5-methyltetrahydropteroyltriglutamate--homocysteine methyltransferase